MQQNTKEIDSIYSKELQVYINHFTDMNNNLWNELSSYFSEVSYKKGEHIYGSSDRADSLYFIVEGLVRSYKLEESGKDFTWTFHCLNMDSMNKRMLMDICVVDYVSFTHNTPEELAFEVLADSRLLRVKKEDMLRLYESSKEWQKFATKLAEDSYAMTRQRTLNLLTKPAKERLAFLEEYFSGVFEKDVNVEHIASYLGITRQQLARLKKM